MSTKQTLRQKRNLIRIALAPVIKKNRAKNYSYANLEDVCEHIDKVAEEVGVGYEHTLFILDGKNCLRTTIYNVDNEDDVIISESIVSAESNVMSTHQATGAGITFFKRYHLVAMFGLLTEKDTDGNTTTAIPKTDKDLDWIAIFTPYIKKGDKSDCLKRYELHQNKMSQEQKKVIAELIDAIETK